MKVLTRCIRNGKHGGSQVAVVDAPGIAGRSAFGAGLHGQVIIPSRQVLKSGTLQL